MPPNSRFQTTIFGGLNKNDQADQLLLRSHQLGQFGWQQVRPAEALEMVNIDFDQKGIKKRLGSTLETTSLNTILAGNETVLSSIDYTSANGAVITVVVTTLSIYTNQSGSFVKVNDSAGSPYNHNATVSKTTFAVVDGHLFIGLDDNNKIQVYKNGEDLDDELDNGNIYEDAFGVGTNTIDGTWGTGYYLLADFQGRLVYSNGNTVVNYSSVPIATDGIWKRSTHGFYQTTGLIIGLKTFTPDYQDSIRETLYIFTAHGPQITNDLTSQIQKIEGGPIPVNHQSIVATKSWLMMLTMDRRIIALNRNTSIDVGRRFTDNTEASKIETFDISNADTAAFAFYNKKREQVYFFVPGSTLTNNSIALMIDLQLSEPTPGQGENLGEDKVRLAEWEINEPSTNAWFATLYQRRGNVIGITPDGKTYNFSNGRNDLDTVLIDSTYESMDFNAGISSVSKQWMLLNLRGQFLGNFSTSITYIFDKADKVVSTTTYTQSSNNAIYGLPLYGQEKYSGILLIKGQDDIDSYSESIRFKLSNSTLNQTFTFDTLDVEYLIGDKDR
jgi:hypothetical protein